MNVTLRLPMTREQFLDWVERQEEPHEFDGTAPVAMTGGNRNHAQLCSNLIFALRTRLEGRPVSVLPEAGIAIGEAAIRYPDVVVTATPGPGTDRLIPDPLIVFEVVSPTSGRIDRTIKLREYQAVESIRRYVIVDAAAPDVDVYERAADRWNAGSLAEGDALGLPELGIEIPVTDIFAGVSFAAP